MAYKNDIPKWIRQIEATTRTTDERVVSELAGRRLDPTYRTVRTVAQALLVGKASRVNELDTVSFVPSSRWGSWIQGVPLLHAAMMNESIIVDLLPIRTEQEFIRQYRCEPRQFVTILRRMQEDGRQVFVNLRDYDGSPQAVEEYQAAHEGVGIVMHSLAEQSFDGTYMNAFRRHAIFEMFGQPELLKDAETLVRAILGPHIDALLNSSTPENLIAAFPKLAVRGGGSVVAKQAIHRIAYHLAFAKLCPGVPGQMGIPLDETIASAMDEAERGGRISHAVIAEVIHRSTMLHHKYTAGITGAYGGAYNIREDELQVSNELWSFTPIADHKQDQDRGFLDFAYGLQMGDIKIKKGIFRNVLEVSQPLSLGQADHIPSSDEIELFFDNMQPVRDVLRSHRELKIALDQYIEKDGSAQTTTALEKYTEAARKHVKSSKSWKKELGKYVGLGSLFAFGSSGALGSLGSLGTAGAVATAGMSGVSVGVAGLPIVIAAAAATVAVAGTNAFLRDKVCSIFCHSESEQQVLRLYNKNA